MNPKLQYNWHAIYTRPRSEKKAFIELEEKGIETYLPLVKTLKQWSDRKKWVEEALFKSYIFVRVSQKEYYDAINMFYTVRYICFEGKAVPIPPPQIEAIKIYINQEENLNVDMSAYKSGEAVHIIEGPMKGLQGTLVRVSGKSKLRIEIDGVGKAVYVNIAGAHVRKAIV